MMTLHDLIHSLTWEHVRTALRVAYPDISDKNMAGYFDVWEKLHTLTPKPSSTRIIVAWIEPDERFNPDGYWDVSGMNELHNKAEGLDADTKLALDFTSWDEWLGMEIDSNTLSRLTGLEIVAHCLWEMTFYGYSEVQVQTTKMEVIGAYQEVVSQWN